MDQQQEITEVENTSEQEGLTNVTTRTVTHKTGAQGRKVLIRTVWLVVEVIAALLLISFLLQLLGANEKSWFVNLMYSASKPFAIPFVGIFKSTQHGKSIFDVASLVAALAYPLIGWVVVKLLTLTSSGNRV